MLTLAVFLLLASAATGQNQTRRGHFSLSLLSTASMSKAELPGREEKRALVP